MKNEHILTFYHLLQIFFLSMTLQIQFNFFLMLCSSYVPPSKPPHRLCDSFSDFPCFYWPWQLWRVLTGHFAEYPSVGMCVMFFPQLRLGLWDLGRKTTEVRCHFYPIMARTHIISMTYSCWCWPWSLGWDNNCQISPLESYPLPAFPSFEGSHYVLYTRMEESVVLQVPEGEESTSIIGNSPAWEICLFSHIHLFKHLLT